MIAFETGLFIDGAFVAGEGACKPARDPARGTLLAEVPSASPAQVDRAVEAAHAAFATWRRTTPKERSRLLWSIADAVEANADTLSEVESLNAGKPRRFVALAELANVADVFRFFATAVGRGGPTGQV